MMHAVWMIPNQLLKICSFKSIR